MELREQFFGAIRRARRLASVPGQAGRAAELHLVHDVVEDQTVEAEAPNQQETEPEPEPIAKFGLLDLSDELVARISVYWTGRPLGLPSKAHNRRTFQVMGGPKEIALRAIRRYGPDRALPELMMMSKDFGIWGRKQVEVDEVPIRAALRVLPGRALGTAWLKALHHARTWKQVASAQVLVETAPWGRFPVNEPIYEMGLTPLCVACELALPTTCIQLFLDNGADVNTPSSDGTPPLLLAAKKGGLEHVELLIHAGAKADDPDSLGTTPLIAASHRGLTDVVKLLLDAGAAINHMAHFDRQTALKRAVFGGHLDTARLLLNSGADIHPTSRLSYTFLGLAATRGDLALILQFLAMGVDPNEPSSGSGLTPLILASAEGHLSCVAALLDAGADPLAMHQWTTPLAEAARNGSVPIIELLHARAGDDVLKGNEGTCALSIACLHGHVDAVTKLLGLGANPNTRLRMSGETTFPILVAVQGGARPDIIRLLLEHGADVKGRMGSQVIKEVKERSGIAPGDREEAIRLLREAGARERG